MQTLDVLEQPLLDLTWMDLTVAVGLVLIAIGVSGWHRTGLARSFAVGAIRTVLQLTLVGYLLVVPSRCPASSTAADLPGPQQAGQSNSRSAMPPVAVP